MITQKEKLKEELQIFFRSYEKMWETLQSLKGVTPNIPDSKIKEWQDELFSVVPCIGRQAIKYLTGEWTYREGEDD